MTTNRDTKDEIALDLFDQSIASRAQAQLRCLGELREAVTNMALAVETRRQQRREEDIPERAMSRLGKLVLQICAMEQQTVALWKKSHEKARTLRMAARRKDVQEKVETAIAAVTPPGPVRAERLDLLQRVLPKYDFSSPAKMRATAEEICRAVGIPFPAEAFPEDGLEAAAKRQVAELKAKLAAQGIEPLLDDDGNDRVPGEAGQRSKTFPGGSAQPVLDVCEADVMEMPPAAIRTNGRGPP